MFLDYSVGTLCCALPTRWSAIVTLKNYHTAITTSTNSARGYLDYNCPGYIIHDWSMLSSSKFGQDYLEIRIHQ